MRGDIEDRIEKALEFLAHSDEQAAELKYEAALAEARYKASVDARFLALDGTVEARKAQARQESEAFYLEYLKAVRDYDVVKHKRDRAVIQIEVGRSQMSDRRHGLVH